jgi:hypothetical protein
LHMPPTVAAITNRTYCHLSLLKSEANIDENHIIWRTIVA